ncbi:MAG TPA: CapA family protein [Mucilaginibacter sp.]|nr:CapA family protein [Mucilaginibacter sp.]
MNKKLFGYRQVKFAGKTLLLFFILPLLLAGCGYRHRPEPEVYHPPEKHPVIIKHDTIRKKDTTIVVAYAVAADTPRIAQDTTRDSLTIAAVGDIMLGTSYPNRSTLPADSAKGSFKNVLNHLHGNDVLMGNLEGTLLDTGAPAYYKLHQLSRAWLFRMPVSYGAVLKDAGFNVLSLANNHIGDFDNAGRLSTMKTLDSLGINYGGQVSHPTAIFRINGVTIGFCAFAPNSYTLPISDLPTVTRVVHKLKSKCNVVIVSFHGGGEGVLYEHIPDSTEIFVREKRGHVKAFAHAAVDAGADLVFGNGPHVCRAMELYKNRLIAYSLGNFYTFNGVSVAGDCGLAPILKVRVNKKGEFLRGEIISARQTHYDGLKIDRMNGAAIRIKELTSQDFPQSGLDISDEGAITRIDNIADQSAQSRQPVPTGLN